MMTKKATGRPLKYLWLREYIEGDVLYSPAGVIDAAMEKGHPMLAALTEAELKDLRVKIRHCLARLIKARGFESDGWVSYHGQAALMAYSGRKWLKALEPEVKHDT